MRAREGWKSFTLVVTSEGGEGTYFYWYSGTEAGDAQVGGLSHAEAGR